MPTYLLQPCRKKKERTIDVAQRWDLAEGSIIAPYLPG